MLYNGTNSGSKTFAFTYDPLNRLNIASSTVGALDETIAYDKMGNISSLIRGGNSSVNLGYNYLDANNNQTNQLFGVINNGAGFRTYGYDANGNATSDGGSKSIGYNMLNLPQNVTQGTTTLATYTYEASGNKIRTRAAMAPGITSAALFTGMGRSTLYKQKMAERYAIRQTVPIVTSITSKIIWAILGYRSIKDQTG